MEDLDLNSKISRLMDLAQKMSDYEYSYRTYAICADASADKDYQTWQNAKKKLKNALLEVITPFNKT